MTGRYMVTGMTERNNHNGAITVTKADALTMWPEDERPSLRTLERYIAEGKIRKETYHNGRVKLVLSDIQALLTPTPAVPASPEVAGTAGVSSSSPRQPAPPAG